MVFEHEGRHASRWETIRSIASKIGCSAEALRNWVKQAEVDSGRREGVSTEERARVKELEREVFENRPRELLQTRKELVEAAGIEPASDQRNILK